MVLIIIIFSIIFLIIFYSANKEHIRNSNSAKLKTHEKEKLIIQIAKKHQGQVTPLDIVAESPLSTEEAEEILKRLSQKGYVDIKVKESGMLVYEFIDFLPRS